MTYENLPAELETGIEVIDKDHNELFGLVKLFREAKAGGNIGLLRTVMVGLEEYTTYHFKKEEIGFEAGGFEGAADHEGEHRGLESKARALGEELKTNPENFTPAKLQEVDDFLMDWLDHHIRKSDMAYLAFFADHPEAVRRMEEFSFAGHLADGVDEIDPLGDILSA